MVPFFVKSKGAPALVVPSTMNGEALWQYIQDVKVQKRLLKEKQKIFAKLGKNPDDAKFTLHTLPPCKPYGYGLIQIQA